MYYLYYFFFFFFFFFFNDTATTEIYTLSLHDALPLWVRRDPDGTTIAAVYNWSDAAKPYRLHFGEAAGAGGTFTITDLWSTRRGGRALGVKTDTLRLTLPPHSVRLLKMKPTAAPAPA